MDNISIKLLESDGAIVKKINNALAKEVDKSIKQRVPVIKQRLGGVLATALYSSPEINSLSNGILAADFGLTSDPSSAIVSSILSTIEIKLKPVKASAATIKGGLMITVQPIDYSNLFSLPIANQVIEDGAIPWLQWLLTFGDAIIIANFGIEYGPFGRSGKAHMTQASRPFKVNSASSGNADYNFISRAVGRYPSQIKNVIIGAI